MKDDRIDVVERGVVRPDVVRLEVSMDNPMHVAVLPDFMHVLRRRHREQSQNQRDEASEGPGRVHEPRLYLKVLYAEVTLTESSETLQSQRPRCPSPLTSSC